MSPTLDQLSAQRGVSSACARFCGLRCARTRGLGGVSVGAVALSVGLASGTANAKQEYYDALVPTGTCLDCRLCHTASPGSATALPTTAADFMAKPFYVAMLEKGLEGSLPDETMDSDGDTFTDLEELENFGDPNDPTVGPDQVECPNQPAYGCLTIADHSSRGSSQSSWPLWALLGLLVLRRRSH